MLIGISPLLSPELLAILCRMGHGDEIVLADAHFPAESFNGRVLRADGHAIDKLLGGIMPLFPLDGYVENPLGMMAAVPGDTLDPTVESRYMRAIRQSWSDAKPPQRIERFAFYERTRSAFAVVMTGETAKYGNIILKKGLVES